MFPGLDVAMDEPRLVRRFERRRDRCEQLVRPLGVERPFPVQQRSEIFPFDEAHGQVEHAVRLAGVVDRDHVGVVDRRRQPRLRQEALPEDLVLGDLGSDQLQRHLPAEVGVLGEIHDAHAAAPEQGLDAVTAELGAEAGIGRHGDSF